MRTSVRIALGATILAVTATATYFHFTAPAASKAPQSRPAAAPPQSAPK